MWGLPEAPYQSTFPSSFKDITNNYQCDEKRPECSYCIKTKQKCSGYVNQFDLAWRDQNIIAQKNVQRRQNARERARLEEDTQRMVPTSKNIPSRMFSFKTGNIPLQLCFDKPEEYALNFFLTFYASQPNNDLERRAFFDYVVPLYFQADENSTMKLSTLAVSSIMYGGWMDRRADSPLARTYYVKAVSAMKEQLNNPGTCADDQMITSVLLLQLYEVNHRSLRKSTSLIVQNLIGVVNRASSPNAHISGALAIINHRDPRNFKTATSQGLLVSVRRQAVSLCLSFLTSLLVT